MTILENHEADISVLWHAVGGSRTECQDQLLELTCGLPIAVLLVGPTGFVTPNALIDDICGLLDDNRVACLSMLGDEPLERCVLIVLSRVPLTIADVSSPAIIPDWFPVGGGEVHNVRIYDALLEARVGLLAPEAHVSEISWQLASIEGALVRRYRLSYEHSKVSAATLLEDLRNDRSADKNTGVAEFIEKFERNQLTIRQPNAYRPSLSATDSLLAQIWRLAQDSSSESLRKPAKRLAVALEFPEDLDVPDPPLTVVLRRSPFTEPHRGIVFAQHLMAAIRDSCQLTTAAAHSDQYPSYPVALLNSVSTDLLRYLQTAQDRVESTQSL